jgi:hypothetical protein
MDLSETLRAASQVCVDVVLTSRHMLHACVDFTHMRHARVDFTHMRHARAVALSALSRSRGV